ncbi:CopD family protein, partial [Serratia ureilytica]|nr:CopD family protein [Serratia ureilytica]
LANKRLVSAQLLGAFDKRRHAHFFPRFTGIVNSLIILGGWPLNLSSPYQRLLLLKTALVALMVMVALANRYAIVPAWAASAWRWRSARTSASACRCCTTP